MTTAWPLPVSAMKAMPSGPTHLIVLCMNTSLLRLDGILARAGQLLFFP
jgi:hypothetical protein